MHTIAHPDDLAATARFLDALAALLPCEGEVTLRRAKYHPYIVTCNLSWDGGRKGRRGIQACIDRRTAPDQLPYVLDHLAYKIQADIERADDH